MTGERRDPPARAATTGADGRETQVHRILPTVEAESAITLRRATSTRQERAALGRDLRHQLPREMLGHWPEQAARRDVIDLVRESNVGRLESLIPVRIGRMIQSPYGWLRGSPNVMARDCSHLPVTGIAPVICGDAHLGNFGFYASPERDLVIDLNDFDEAHTGPWEWDLWRLVASIWVAGRQNCASEPACAAAVEQCVQIYRREMRHLADEPLLYRSFERLEVARMHESTTEKSLRDEIERAAAQARRRTSDRALPKLTRTDASGQRRIVDKPPLVTRLPAREVEQIAVALDEYLQTLAPHWRRVLGGYTLVDVAHKVVGVGSVGLRAYVALLVGSSPDDVVFLQVKQARRSVVAPHVHGDLAWHAHQGQRVVEYQQALQTVSDPLLGWTTIDRRHFYVRQYRDMKGAVAIDAMDAPALAAYAGVLGHLLAKGHARISGASMICGYVGKGDALDRAMVRFARAYADQVEADHAALVRAVRAGLLPAEEGI